jgi:CubicO group peptidase (beta-lactamase class C family)
MRAEAGPAHHRRRGARRPKGRAAIGRDPLHHPTRRAFLAAAGCASAPLFLGAAAAPDDDLDDFIEAERHARRIPGLTACIVKSGKVAWSKGYGWANIAKRVPMDPDRTLQNIGSISKTVTATAVMQLWEKGKFQLDDDINERLPFPVRIPSHPDVPITYRLLLTHRSGIADSPAYGTSYACGDPKSSLEAWLKDYFTPSGRHHDPKANFHPWKPGSKDAYSNVGFGLLGYLVERISGVPFADYTRKNIFGPLGMDRTGWLLSEIDVAAHAIPYIPTTDAAEVETARKYGLLAGDPERDPGSGDHQPLCLYSFPNYPDGSLRTSANQLARFLLAYANDGALGDARILAPDTIRLMLTPQAATSPGQGLCWATEHREGHRHWGHNGSDPGIETNMSFRPADGIGTILFANRADMDLSAIDRRLFAKAAQL